MSPVKEDHRQLWELDCFVLCTLISVSCNPKKIRKICLKFNILSKGEVFTAAKGFYLIHKCCHHKDHPVPKALREWLNQKYNVLIGKVRALECSNKSAINDIVNEELESNPSSLLWAFISDKREFIHNHGVYLIHKYVLEQSGKSQSQIEKKNSLQSQFTYLEQNYQKAMAKNVLLKNKAQALQREASDLERINRDLVARKEDIIQVPCDNKLISENKKLKKEIMKLEYQLHKKEPENVGGNNHNKSEKQDAIIDVCKKIIEEMNLFKYVLHVHT